MTALIHWLTGLGDRDLQYVLYVFAAGIAIGGVLVVIGMLLGMRIEDWRTKRRLRDRWRNWG